MRILFTFLFLLLISGVAKAKDPVYFASHPALSPDGKMLVFSYNGDIWKADVQSGEASRLTAMQGLASHPRISPDGKWLAFSANQYGNMDVYLMPLDGGKVQQLTVHDAADEVSGWSWDSKTIYFTSSRYNRYSAYQVGIEGGTAKRVFGHYFNFIHDLVEAPTGELFFSDTWESKDQAHRKGYKGPFNPEIQSYNPKTKEHKLYTNYPGKDFWTTIDEKGKVYFVSDEANGEYNLYTFENGVKTPLTTFDRSIKRPFVAANGSKVVFEKDYQLFIYDVASKATSALTLHTTRSNTLEMAKKFNVSGSIEKFDVSPDGKKLAFVSRGELFVSDLTGNFIQKIARPTVDRVLEVLWLTDNQTLLFNQTVEGFQNLFTLQVGKASSLKQLTFDQRNNRALAFDSKREQVVYLSGRDEVRVLNLATGNSEVVVKDEVWAIQSSSPSFSPNDEYLLFTAFRNFEQDIFVHHLKDKKTINLTNTGVSEANPFWSPDGKYIYFTSSLYKPSYPFGMQEPSVYRIALDHFDAPYKSEAFDKMFDETKKPDSVKTKLPERLSLNPVKIMDRLERVSPSFGSQYGGMAVQQGGKTYVFYLSNQVEGKPAVYRTVYEDFKEPKTEKVTDARNFDARMVNEKIYALLNGSLYTYSLDKNQESKIDMHYDYQRDLAGEFNQMYFETWAGLDENFYDETYHGKDWGKVKEHYASFLPYINNRADLRILLNDMLGELNSSHIGFSSSGEEENTAGRMMTSETGIVFDNENPYRVNRVLENSVLYKNATPVRKGDVLTHVNGVAVERHRDRDSYFTSAFIQEELRLTFERQGKKIEVLTHTQSTSALKDNLYEEWIDQNRNRTSEWGKNRIAYSHMKNMSTGELQVFLKDMIAQEDKEGVILDLRYNTGGNVHDEVLRFLSQRPYLNWKYRGGGLSPQSNFAPAAKPIVLLINEQSLSDAEMTAAGFKALGLGTIVGNETYRWIIFTSAKSLVDGSSYRIPAWGTYTLEGKDIELEGVSPDVWVLNTFSDRMENKDPQLKKAVELILEKLN